MEELGNMHQTHVKSVESYKRAFTERDSISSITSFDDQTSFRFSLKTFPKLKIAFRRSYILHRLSKVVKLCSVTDRMHFTSEMNFATLRLARFVMLLALCCSSYMCRLLQNDRVKSGQQAMNALFATLPRLSLSFLRRRDESRTVIGTFRLSFDWSILSRPFSIKNAIETFECVFCRWTDSDGIASFR